MSTALITLAIDLPDYAAGAHAVFASYARRHDMAFEVIDRPRFHIRPNLFRKRRVWMHIEKFQLFDAFQRYERILFLDSDILIQPHCPDLCSLVPKGWFGCAFDDAGPEAWKRREELQRLGKKLGLLPDSASWRYFNSGVMVMDRSHQPLFKMSRSDFHRGRWPEQTLLNYRACKAGLPIHELDPSFNFFPSPGNNWNDSAARAAAHLVHYASQPAKQILQQDLPATLAAWGLSAPDA